MSSTNCPHNRSRLSTTVHHMSTTCTRRMSATLLACQHNLRTFVRVKKNILQHNLRHVAQLCLHVKKLLSIPLACGWLWGIKRMQLLLREGGRYTSTLPPPFTTLHHKTARQLHHNIRNRSNEPSPTLPYIWLSLSVKID